MYNNFIALYNVIYKIFRIEQTVLLITLSFLDKYINLLFIHIVRC